MSMLAEPRRKQKVINLRAKNNAWSNDSNKFGQRMLEKMGWSSGKGLGAKENGIVEHVVAKYKNDEKGLGFEDRNDQWTKNEDDFNTLLATLSNAESGTDTFHSGISLEKKSKKSKARIHYHKFTRGKDLSRYSEKDLANIFGKKSFKEPVLEDCKIEDTVKITEQVFTEKGNMDDYFKTKLAAIKSKLANTSMKNNDESEYTFQGFSNSSELDTNQNGFVCQPFSFYGTQTCDVSQNVEFTNPDVEVKSKKKKKSKQKEISSEAEVAENNLQEETQAIVMEVNIKKKRKSKKTCLKENNQEKIEINLPECMQEVSEEITKDKETIKIKKNSKKRNRVCVEDEIQPCEEIKKKKKKNKNCVENIAGNDVSSVEVSIHKKKKRKNLVL